MGFPQHPPADDGAIGAVAVAITRIPVSMGAAAIAGTVVMARAAVNDSGSMTRKENPGAECAGR